MGFKMWIEQLELEGFGFNLANIPTVKDMKTLNRSVRAGINAQSKKQVMQIFADKNKDYEIFDFDPENRPWDLISVKPIDKTSSLPQLKIPNKQLLDTFRDMKIYYGFEFVPKPTIGDSSMYNNDSGQLERSKMDLAKIDQEIQNKQNPYIDMVSLENKHPDFYEKISQVAHITNVDQKTKILANQGIAVNPWVINRYLNEWLPYKQLKIAPLVQKQQELKTVIQQYNRPFFNKRQMQFYISLARNALGKIIKHPTNQRERTLQEQLIHCAVQRYKTFRPNSVYDYIVYPESSSDFNELLAYAFSEAYPGSKPIRGFEKLTRVEVDNANWAKNNPGKKPPKAPNQNEKFQMKNIRFQQHRPFYKMFQKSELQGDSFKRRRILLVDDNVSSSGTMQGLYKILRRDRPQHVDIYAPIYYNIHR